MPYPGQFHRLVMIGTWYTDQFNMTLNIVPSGLGELRMPAVDETQLAAAAAVVGTWFPLSQGSPGMGFSEHAKLTSIKLNRVGPDGRYVDSIAREHVYSSPIAGPLSITPAPQLSLAVTLRTAIERGRGSKGRVYPPGGNWSNGVNADGRASTTQATGQANGMKALINPLNTLYSLIGRVGVASNAGAGRFEHVTHLDVGRVMDTIRSRRSSLVEDYQTVTL